MQNDPSVELHVCFKRSYDEVLRYHHTFVVRSLAVVRHFILPPLLARLGLQIHRLRSTGLGRRQGRPLPSRFYCSHLARRRQGEVRH